MQDHSCRRLYQWIYEKLGIFPSWHSWSEEWGDRASEIWLWETTRQKLLNRSARWITRKIIAEEIIYEPLASWRKEKQLGIKHLPKWANFLKTNCNCLLSNSNESIWWGFPFPPILVQSWCASWTLVTEIRCSVMQRSWRNGNLYQRRPLRCIPWSKE